MNRFHLVGIAGLLGLSSSWRWDESARAASSVPLKGGEVEFVYLANEGFLVRSKERAFVIDAFLKEPLGFYAALSPELHEKLVAAEEPFDDVDLALVSHAHADHFQPRSAVAFLQASTDTHLATSPQVLASLETELGDDAAADALRARLSSLLPEAGESLPFDHNGIEVAFLRLPHSGNRPGIENLGHLIQFEGLTILHIGDADGSDGALEPYGIQDIHIDVALLPYWIWSSPAGRALIDTQLAADTLIAIHVPPREVAAVAEALSSAEGGGVHVFRESLETLRFSID